MSETEFGTVVWFDRIRRFGFISPDNNELGTEGNVFVYHLNIVDGDECLVRGERVSFERGSYKGKPQAVNVQSLDDAEWAAEERQ